MSSLMWYGCETMFWAVWLSLMEEGKEKKRKAGGEELSLFPPMCLPLTSMSHLMWLFLPCHLSLCLLFLLLFFLLLACLPPHFCTFALAPACPLACPMQHDMRAAAERTGGR